MDTEKYTGMAEEYLKFRNDYPKEFIRYLYENVGISKNSLIADIGSGTGEDKYIVELSNLFDKHCMDDFLSITLYTRTLIGEVWNENRINLSLSGTKREAGWFEREYIFIRRWIDGLDRKTK